MESRSEERSDDMTKREADRTAKGEPPARNFNQFVGTKKAPRFVRL
jgi:hypothetical protein